MMIKQNNSTMNDQEEIKSNASAKRKLVFNT